MGCCCNEDSDVDDLTKKRDIHSNLSIRRNRGCTDVICCLIFIFFIVVFIAVAIWSFTMGDLRRIIYPSDSKGKICGLDFPDKPNLYFFNPVKCLRYGPAAIALGCPTPQVCVAKCPTEYWTSQINNRSQMVCLGGHNGAFDEYAGQSISDLVRKDICAPYVIKSYPVFGRCVPSQIASLLNKGKELTIGGTVVTIQDELGKDVNITDISRSKKILLEMQSVFQYAMQDLSQAWPMILGALIFAALVSLIWCILMRFAAKVMVILTLVSFVLLFAAGTILSFWRYIVLRNRNPEDQKFELTTDIASYFQLGKTWLAMGIIFAIIFVLVVAVLIFLRNRIRIAIAVINETSKAIGEMMSLLLYPLLPFILVLATTAFCFFVALYIRSIRDEVSIEKPTGIEEEEIMDKIRKGLSHVFEKVPCNPNRPNSTRAKICTFVKYGGKSFAIYLQIFTVFMYFWLVNFALALAEMSLAGAYAHFYFSRLDPALMPTFPLLTSFWQSIRYHTGSLAFGSLLIALLKMVRLFLEWVDAKVKNSENACAKFFIKCLMCCFWCLEKFIRFLNRNAYIMIAIYGKNFCTSSKNAFMLILRNCVRVVVVDKVADFVLFVGKLVIIGTTGALSFFYFDGTINVTVVESFRTNLHYPYIPVLIIVICSYLISSLFFGVFEMGVDTIFLCFLEDLERNDGSPERPYFMSKELMVILGKENTQDEK